MKSGFTHFYYFISCPSDIDEEVNIIMDVIDELNFTIGEPNNINIKCLHWRKNTIPSAGTSAQNIINQQLLARADGLIGILWTKFGTPTETYGSGTEEEIENMISSDRNVMVYFSEKPIRPSELDHYQYKQVLAFKQKYKGLFHSYDSNSTFEKDFRRHMETLFMKLAEDDDVTKVKDNYQNRIIRSLVDYVANIKMTIIDLQCQRIDITQGLMNFYNTSGDLQLYVENNKLILLDYKEKNDVDVYHYTDLETLLALVVSAGNSMEVNPIEFGHKLNEVRDLCTELVQCYNKILGPI